MLSTRGNPRRCVVVDVAERLVAFVWFSYAPRIDGGLGGSRNIVPLSVEGSLTAFLERSVRSVMRRPLLQQKRNLLITVPCTYMISTYEYLYTNPFEAKTR